MKDRTQSAIRVRGRTDFSTRERDRAARPTASHASTFLRLESIPKTHAPSSLLFWRFVLRMKPLIRMEKKTFAGVNKLEP